jgi:hypothetical protein
MCQATWCRGRRLLPKNIKMGESPHSPFVTSLLHVIGSLESSTRTILGCMSILRHDA